MIMAERKQRKTQQELIIAEASRLFWEKGYAETSMKDIASACGFRPANIYNFFDGKESILYEILLQEMVEIVSPIEHLKDDEGVDPVMPADDDGKPREAHPGGKEHVEASL